MTQADDIRRDGHAGVTLVEILVVLALVGVMTGAVALSLGSVGRGNSIDQEAQLLIARLNRAADETILTATPMRFGWTDDSYRFEVLSEGAWQAHPVGVLAASQTLPNGLQLASDDDTDFLIVDENLVPATGRALDLRLSSDRGAGLAIRFNGVTATIVDDNT